MKSVLTQSHSRQPPPKPSEKFDRPRSAQDDVVDPGHAERAEALKKAIVSTLKGTEWPSDSTDAAEIFINTIKSCPDISMNNSNPTKEAQNLIEKYLEILDDIHVRLRDASSKAAMKRWKFLELMKSLGSNRPSKCALLFQTSQDDLSKATNAVKKHLESEREKVDCVEGAVGLSSKIQIYSSVQGGAQSLARDLPTGTAERGTASGVSPPNSRLPRQPLSTTPKDGKGRIPIGEEALSIARKTFKSVEIGSGAIPVVGSYVGAAAKVGLAFVEMLQTMDRNDTLAIDLGDRTSKLTSLLENFKPKSIENEENIAGHINALHRELVQVKEKVEEWSTLGRFRKAFSA
ncbi:hypothetical protein M407DRAFT_35059, partial [Tulasnella calospora MUT 4182]